MITNVELDHHSEFALARRARGGVRRAGRGARRRGRARRAALRRAARRCRASTTAPNAGAALAALELAGVARDEAAAALGALHAAPGRRFEVSRGRRGDDRRRLRPPPERARGDDRRRPRGLPGPAAARALPAAPRLAHAPPRAPSSARRSPRADEVVVTELYPAREAPIPGVSGKLVVDALSDRGALPGLDPRSSSEAAAYLGGARAARRRPARARRRRRRPRAGAHRGRLARGAGVIERSRRASRSRASRRSAPAARRATSAGPRAVAELDEAARAGRAASGLAVETIGLGSNVLAADDGRRRARPAAGGRARGRPRSRARRSSPAAARRTPSASTARATPGLGGFEFASAIPGTVGGGVRMNAGAYGSDLRRVVLEATVVVGATGRATARRRRARARLPPLGARARARSSREVRLASRARATPAEIKARGRRAARPAQGEPADDQAHLRQRLQEPARRARAPAALIEALRAEGATGSAARVISSRHANFIENAGGATSADALALMAEARRRVHERFGVVLEHEVRFLGPLELPPL